MAIFKSYRINLSKKTYTGDLFEKSLTENDINNKRTDLIKAVFTKENIEFNHRNCKYIYHYKGIYDDIIYGSLLKETIQKNRNKNEEVKVNQHYEKSIILINSKYDGENWQKIFIQEIAPHFKKVSFDKFITDLWQSACISSDFDISINPFLANFSENFFDYFDNPQKYNLKIIQSLDIKYTITNHGTYSIKNAMEAVQATEYDRHYGNKDGLKITNRQIIEEDISEIGKGVNGSTIIKGLKINGGKTTIDSSKKGTVETTEYPDFEADSIEGKDAVEIYKSLISTLYGTK